MKFDLLTEAEAAEMLGMAKGTLRNWRHSGQGPKYLIVGARVIRYRTSDLLEFVERQTVDPSAA